MLRALFWSSAGLLLYTHLGYPLVLWAVDRVRRRSERTPTARGAGPAAGAAGPTPRPDDDELPTVSLIVAAHDEEEAIAARVANALALDYPPDRLEVIVASDGSSDGTVEQAKRAGASVLDLPRLGKVRAQDRAVEAARGEVLAFSDANSAWAPDALRHLVGALADPSVGYVCGEVRLHGGSGANQEGVYWRLENAIRALESRLGGITAGNGAIYAVRRSAYLQLDPRTSHDLSFPFNTVKRGLRAVYEPRARAREAMAPTLEGEFRRKRRMMRHAWPTVLGGGLLRPRGYPPGYALEVASHRLLRYASPALHLVALTTSVLLASRGRTYRTALAAQMALLGSAVAAPAAATRPTRLARYYVLVTSALAAGLWDHLRHGTPPYWDRGEGER